MKLITKHVISVFPDQDRYSPRACIINLSDEIFTPAEFIQITNLTQNAAMKWGFEMSLTTTKAEVPETEEEIAAVKTAENEEKKATEKRNAERKQKLMAETIDKAVKSPKAYTLAIEDALQDINSWERESVRQLLRDSNSYSLED